MRSIKFSKEVSGLLRTGNVPWLTCRAAGSLSTFFYWVVAFDSPTSSSQLDRDCAQLAFHSREGIGHQANGNSCTTIAVLKLLSTSSAKRWRAHYNWRRRAIQRKRNGSATKVIIIMADIQDDKSYSLILETGLPTVQKQSKLLCASYAATGEWRPNF